MKLFAEKESGVYGDYLQNNNFKSVVVYGLQNETKCIWTDWCWWIKVIRLCSTGGTSKIMFKNVWSRKMCIYI